MSRAAMRPDEPVRPTPPVPFFLLNGLQIHDVGEAGAVCSSEVRPWLGGAAELGIQAAAVALADCALNYAVAYRSSGDRYPVSLGLRLDYWRPPPSLGSALSGTAAVAATTEDTFLIRGQIGGPKQVLATATLRSLLIKHGPPPVPTGGSVAPRVELVPALGEGWPSGGHSLDAILSLPAARLAGLELLRTGTGSIELKARPDAALERTEGVVHGGAVPVLGQLGCAAVLALALPDVLAPQRLDTNTEFLRPTFVDASLTMRARLVHRSRRVATLHAEILNDKGKPTARIYETVLVGRD